MKPFRTIRAADLDSVSLTTEMENYGYVFLQGLIPKPDLQPLLNGLLDIASDEGWLLAGTAPADRIADPAMACFDPQPRHKQASNRAFCLEHLHALKHHPALTDVMRRLVGPHLLIHPKPFARVVFPNCEGALFHAHQDHSGIAGIPDTYTAWTPLHDCAQGQGTLEILEGSHRFGLQQAAGWIDRETAHGDAWVGGPINAGDVVIFHSLTIHSSTLSTSHQLRCSMDCRFQSYDEAISPLEIVFPNQAKGGRSWETTYAGWQQDHLKFYWRDLPLRLKPSIADLTEQARTADTPEKRQRYATILELIEQEIPTLVR